MTSPVIPGRSFSQRDVQDYDNTPVGTPKRPSLEGRQRYGDNGGGVPLHKGMRPMFMTPREIQSHYQVLDGDRYENYAETYGTNDSRAGERTQRVRRTDGAYNPQTEVNAYDSDGEALGRVPVRIRPDANHPTSVQRQETDEEVLARKYEEADEAPASGYHGNNGGWGNSNGTRYYDERFDATTSSPGHYTGKPGGPLRMIDRMTQRNGREVPNYRRNPGSAWSGMSTFGSRRHTGDDETWVSHPEVAKSPDQPQHSSMVESIINQGVLSPIRLGTENIGSQGKQEMVGGHHRFAVALNHAPDKLVPVLFHKDIFDAKADRSYPYT
jgi:hypothetical protein